MNFINRLQEKWQIPTRKDMYIILLVFAISGSLSMFLSKPILTFFEIDRNKLGELKFWPLRILVMFVSYYIVLITVGTILGQHTFFKKFALKTIYRFVGKNYEG